MIKQILLGIRQTALEFDFKGALKNAMNLSTFFLLKMAS